MNCPKCNGEVISIKDGYYCSQCGEKISLEELKQHLEQKMVVEKAKSGVVYQGEDKQTQQEEKKPSSVQIPVDQSAIRVSPKPIEHQAPISIQHLNSISSEGPSVSGQAAVNRALPKSVEKIDQQLHGVKKSYQFKILLTVIIILNVLIILEITYFLFIR
ncbi:hypothetical protein CO152_03680 [bacterium CG_4_9_14_3_um_filter_33_26]|nr:MAG: hypothetical protein CO152_03680 [bacterium CG_4_9_14_3_um_filter_33_26]